MTVNDDSRVVRITLQYVTSTTIIILTTLEVSFMLLDNVYSTGITHDDRHMTIVIYIKYRPQGPILLNFSWT
jgi:hypothetical protein